MRRIGFVIAAGVLAFSVSASAAPPAPKGSLGVVTNAHVAETIWHLPFRDSYGVRHTLADLRGTTMIVPFLTLCPDVCPFTTGNAIQTARLLQSRHATNVRVVEITVDPRRDTVSRLQQYRKLVGLRERDRAITIWRTSPRNTEILKAYFGMTTEKMAVDAVHKDWMTNRPIAYEMDHSDGFYIVTDAQKLRFVSGLSARFVGKLTKAMTGFLNEEGLETLEHPSPGWTPRGALTALSYVAGSKF